MINEAIIKQVNTPGYIYHEEIIKQKYLSLSKAITTKSGLFYSMKANPRKEICKIIYQLGASIEVASTGELAIALEAGVSPCFIVFTSPGKTEKELEFAIDAGIKYINIDSLEEAQIINRIATKKEKMVNVLVRINPAQSFSKAKIQMSGISSQFGVEEEQIDGFFKGINQLDHVEVKGFHMYVGTQILSAEDIEKNTDYALGLFVHLTDLYHIKAEMFDVGGGFGVKYFENEKELDLEELEIRLQRIYDKYSDKIGTTQIMFESGRYLVAEAGEFITKVLYIKESKGTKYVVCDGGSNFHSAAAFLGRFVRNNFPLITFPKGDTVECATVTGPLCTPLDVIGQKVAINSTIQPNDYVVILKSGAYGLTYSPVLFLSHEMPVEYLEKDGRLIELPSYIKTMNIEVRHENE